jgi:hypothetical protein
MSTRERWIVYPILFLTLGIAVRDKIVPPTHWGGRALHVNGEIATEQLQCKTQLRAGEIVAAQLRCKQLLVENIICKRLESGRAECRMFLVNGPNNKPVVAALADAKTHAGVLETLSAKGLPQVQLLSTPTGGVVNTIGAGGRAQLVLGDLGQGLGLFAQLPGRELLPLTRPLRVETVPSLPQPPKNPAEPPKKTSPPKTKIGT